MFAHSQQDVFPAIEPEFNLELFLQVLSSCVTGFGPPGSTALCSASIIFAGRVSSLQVDVLFALCCC
jgi:hypothetical protein